MRSLLRIRFLNIRDGSPHCGPLSNPITWTSQDIPQIQGGKLAITDSRVMLYFSHPNAAPPNRTLVWDRTTGNLVRVPWLRGSHILLTAPQVLEFPSMEYRRLDDPSIFFLDEFRVVVLTLPIGTNSLELIVFNTSIPQGHPRSIRRFRLPPQYDNEHYSALIHIDQDRYLGTPNKDVALITDPTQAILVIHVSKPPYLGGVLHIVRIQTLIEHVCSTRADVYIPWNEWGRGAVVMKMPWYPDVMFSIHGIHMTVFIRLWRSDLTCRIHNFDFGQRGYSTLPLWNGEGSKAEKGALFEGGKEFIFKVARSDGTFLWPDTKSLDNGTFFLQVSYITNSSINGVVC